MGLQVGGHVLGLPVSGLGDGEVLNYPHSQLQTRAVNEVRMCTAASTPITLAVAPFGRRGNGKSDLTAKGTRSHPHTGTFDRSVEVRELDASHRRRRGGDRVSSACMELA